LLVGLTPGTSAKVHSASYEHLAGDLEQSLTERSGLAGASGEFSQLANQMRPTLLLLQDIEPLIAHVATRGHEPAEVLAQQPLGGLLRALRIDPVADPPPWWWPSTLARDHAARG